MSDNSQRTYKLYFRRWLILAVSSLSSTINNVTWISLASITSIVQEYYNVSPIFIEWLAIVFSVFMTLLLIPSSYFLNRFGLRLTVSIGGAVNAFGSCIRLIGSRSSRFLYMFIGSCICGLAHAVLLFLSPHMAAVWFGDRERTAASSMGVFVSYSGIALGFLLPSFFVSGVRTHESDIRYGMRNLLMFEAITSTLLFIACVCIVRDAPPTPPSRSQDLRTKLLSENFNDDMSVSPVKNDSLQLKKTKYGRATEMKYSHSLDTYNQTRFYSTFEQEDNDDETSDDKAPSFKDALKSLLRDKQFHILCQAYAIYTGSNYTYTTILNQITVFSFPGKEKEIGYMGFAALMSGLISMLLCGVVLNKTKQFKTFAIVIFALATISMLLLTVALHIGAGAAVVFVLYIVYGLFMYPYLSVGLEFIAEITYPIPEIISSSVCLLLSSFYGIILTQIIGLQLSTGINIGGYIISGLYALGFLLVVVVKGRLKRSFVDNTTKKEEEFQE